MPARRRLADIPERKRRERVERSLDLGLPAAPSVEDRDISLFSRGLDPMFAGITTFLKTPYCENVFVMIGADPHTAGLPPTIALYGIIKDELISQRGGSP
jgi:hypothetical protein